MLTPQRKGSDYHHGDLRHAAIMAARSLVASQGMAALGLRKVSEKVAVSPAALYRHFEDLEQLRAELSAQVRIEIGELMVAKRDRTAKSKSRRRKLNPQKIPINDAAAFRQQSLDLFLYLALIRFHPQ